MSEEQTGLVSSRSDAEGLEIVRIFDAPRERVFEAWTTPAGFSAWFGEHGSSIPLDRAEMDVRPGGTWRAIMVIEESGTELLFAGVYREVEPPARLVLTVTDQEPTEEAPADVVTVVLDDLGDDRTRMTMSQLGGHMPAEEYERAMRGWLIFFERQADHLKARHDSD